MKDITSTSFGYIVAFLLPGLIGMYGLGYWSEGVKKLLKPALSAEATVGPSVILLLGALALGLVISAVRCLAFERFMCRKHKFPTDMFSRLSSGDKLNSFRAVVDEHYRYHQFYGGSFVALVVMYSGWIKNFYPGLHTPFIIFSIGFLLLEILLLDTANDAYKKYVRRGNTIVSGDEIARGASHTARR
jgi:hypothetical protein